MNIQKTTNRLLVSLSLLAAFMATSFSPIFAESGNSVSSKQCKLNKICKIVKEDLEIDKQILDIVSCGACIRITPKDFMDANGNLSQSYVITTPGVYCLCSSIDFTPAFDGQDAIQILSNDVTLDLGGNILRQANDAQDVTGVRIGEDFSETAVYKNITVRNGDIFNFTGQGIGALNVAIAVTGDAFENLTFSDLTVSECGSIPNFNFASGINLDSFANLGPDELVAYKDVTIVRCKANNCLGNGAINIYTCDGLVIQDTQANNLSATSSPLDQLLGVQIFGRNIQLSNVKANGTHGVGSTRINTIIGILVLSSKNVSMVGCQANDTLSEGPSSLQTSGINCARNNSIQLIDCQANGTRALGSQSEVVNLYCFATQNLTMIGCEFNNARSEDKTSSTAGLRLSESRNITISGCQCNNTVGLNSNTVGNRIDICTNVFVQDTLFNNTRNQSPEAPISNNQTAGLFSENGNSHYFLNCQFNNTFSETSNIVQGVNCSFSDNTLYEKCQFNNTAGGASAGLIAGIHMSDSRNTQDQGNGMKWLNCQFNGARVSDLNPGGPKALVCGFLAITLKNIIFEECHATNIISNNPNFNAYGFIIGTEGFDPAPGFANVHNVTFSNCIISDIRGGRETIGIDAFVDAANAVSGIQGFQTNFVIQNCIAERISSPSSTERVAGIAEGIFPFVNIPYQFPRMINLSVKDCRISDIRAGEGNPFSAGILVESVENPVLSGNSVSDCDRGILFTGSNTITPNGFQLATSPADALAFPPVFIDLTSIPAAAPLQTFSNTTQANAVSIAPSDTTIALVQDFILPTDDLTALGWQTTDSIVYSNGGGDDIGGLVDGTTYYAIVYRPGFTERGLVQTNKVTNCSVAGYQDDRTPTTSGWVDNTALINGPTPAHAENYAINWGIPAPVDEGSLTTGYPETEHKYYNLSLIP